MKQQKRYVLSGVLVAFALASTAQADERSEVTIDVVPMEGSMADVSEGRIELPEQASETAREAAAPGLERANEARQRREAFGRETSRNARDVREVRRDGERESRPGDGIERPGGDRNRP